MTSGIVAIIYIIIALITLSFLYLCLDSLGLLFIDPKIKNLPMVSNSWPIAGNIFQTLEDPCLRYLEWSQSLNAEVYQVRLGNRIVVVANSFDSIRDLWLKNTVANNSRPVLYTFHQVVSKGDQFTVGTTPFCEAYKQKRKYLSAHLHKRAVDSFSASISIEADRTVIRLIQQLQFFNTNNLNNQGYQSHDISLLKPIQYFTLRLSLLMTYGYDPELVDCELADEVIHVENRIVQMRSHTSNIQDYLPIWRFFSHGKNDEAVKLRQRRNRYMDKFFLYAVNQPEKACLVNNVLNDTCRDISIEGLKSICLTMVSAGLDNVGLNLDHCIGQLSLSPEIQARALKQILITFGSEEIAWNYCHTDNLQCDYIVALIRETLRYFTVLPLSLPRCTTKDIHYQHAVIPAGTILFMNAYAGNHDERYFPNSHKFIPERYLDDEFKLLTKYSSNNARKSCGIPSFSFGVGARMCAGNHLAFKQLYILLIKIILVFKISEPSDPSYKMEPDPLKANKDPTSIAIEPKDFKVNLSLRDSEFAFKLLSGV